MAVGGVSVRRMMRTWLWMVVLAMSPHGKPALGTAYAP
jgi:hypothetical protein